MVGLKIIQISELLNLNRKFVHTRRTAASSQAVNRIAEQVSFLPERRGPARRPEPANMRYAPRRLSAAPMGRRYVIRCEALHLGAVAISDMINGLQAAVRGLAAAIIVINRLNP